LARNNPPKINTTAPPMIIQVRLLLLFVAILLVNSR
jgi:hypothetical protein